MIIPFLAPLSVTFALAGGGCALLAALCRGKPWSNNFNKLSYVFMGLSISLFILRGFLA